MERRPALGYLLAASAAILWSLNGSLARFLLDDGLGAERLDRVQRAGRPLAVERVTRVERGLRLHEVAGEEDLLAREPRHDVALGVTAPAELQDEVAALAAQRDRQPVGERQRRPRQAGD